jgi:hypothetical protein
MKIISPFKDYYDYVAHIYGGGDPKIVYNRNRLTDEKLYEGSSIYRSVRIDSTELLNDDLPYLPTKTDFGFKWLAVCGKLYLIVNHEFTHLQPYEISKFQPHILSEKTDPELYRTLTERSKYLWSTRRTVWIDVESKTAIQISRKIKAPVFTFVYTNSGVIIDSDIPKLVDLGFPTLRSAEQLYQDISYFMANTIHESPDMMPRTVMTDKERILQHGFDLKQSFRHRK